VDEFIRWLIMIGTNCGQRRRQAYQASMLMWLCYETV